MKATPLAFACVLAATATITQARGVSPYLPLHIDPGIEREIERALILADSPVLTRPIPAAALLDALPRVCRIDEALCAQLRGYLDEYMQNLSIDHVGIEGLATDDATKAVPNAHGRDVSSGWLASARGFWQPGDYLAFNFGAVAYEGKVSPAGSFLSVGVDRAQLDVGYRDHWLSPFTDSSLLIGTQAPTMPSITLSNYVPLTRFGLRYQLFAARMSHSDRIEADTGLTSGHPGLLGVHASIEPAIGWSLGVNRLVQFGGGDRKVGSLRRILKAFLSPASTDNGRGTGEFGNQLASVTSSFTFPGEVPFQVYFEYAGEDTSRGRNYLLGNAALSAGIHFPSLWRGFDLTYETTTWQNGWYVNHLYGDGLTNDGHVIGHWFGDERVPGDDVGGESHMLRLGYQPVLGGSLEMRLRTLANEDYSSTRYHRARDVTLRYSYPVGDFSIGAEVFAGRDVFGESFSQAGLFINHGIHGPTRAGARSAADHDAAEVFVDVGVNASDVTRDLARELPRTKSGLEAAGHFALGARRAVSSRSDLGVRVELDDIDGDLLLGFRALDYRYRFRGPLAFTSFLGAARYELATPAYGIYGGIGLQWRDVRKGWDLGADLRYATKVARDRLLPSDPQSARPDLFYDIPSATIYLSRRF